MAKIPNVATERPSRNVMYYPLGDGSACTIGDLRRLSSTGQSQGLLVSPGREWNIEDPQTKFNTLVNRLFADKPGYREQYRCQWYDSGMQHLLITTVDWQPGREPAVERGKIGADWY